MCAGFWNEPGRGALTLKGGMGMSGSQDPPFYTSSLNPQMQHDSVLQTPALSKNNNFWLLKEKFVKNFSSTA